MTTRPLRPASTHLWFALGGGILTVLLVIGGEGGSAGIMAILTALWLTTGLWRVDRMVRAVAEATAVGVALDARLDGDGQAGSAGARRAVRHIS